MASQIPVKDSDISAPTPQNTPLQAAPIAQGLSRPTVPAISEEDEDAEIAATAEQATMAGLMHSRLADLLGRSSGYVESLPVEVRRSVEALKGVQAKYNELQQQYKQEAWELEKKYLDLQKPLFERRSAIISGTAPATAEEIAAGEKVSQDDAEDEEYEPLPEISGDAASAVQPIPEFWLTALRNHIDLNEIITDRDAEVLKFLTDVRLSFTPNNEPAPGYKLEFVFAKNDWFENEVLEKTYLYQPEVGYSGDFIYERAIGTEIKWKSDEKDLTKTVEVKKQRNKNTNRTRLVRKTKPADSFFNFFNPPVSPEDVDEEDEDTLREIEIKLEVDYQIGEDFKEKIIPRAIDYFTGKALEYESMDDDDDEFEDLDSDEDGSEGSESDVDAPPRRRGKGRGGAAAAGVDAGECKQQ